MKDKNTEVSSSTSTLLTAYIISGEIVKRALGKEVRLNKVEATSPVLEQLVCDAVNTNIQGS